MSEASTPAQFDSTPSKKIASPRIAVELAFHLLLFNRIAAALNFLALQSNGDFLQQPDTPSLRPIGKHPSCCTTTKARIPSGIGHSPAVG